MSAVATHATQKTCTQMLSAMGTPLLLAEARVRTSIAAGALPRLLEPYFPRRSVVRPVVGSVGTNDSAPRTSGELGVGAGGNCVSCPPGAGKLLRQLGGWPRVTRSTSISPSQSYSPRRNVPAERHHGSPDGIRVGPANDSRAC